MLVASDLALNFIVEGARRISLVQGTLISKSKHLWTYFKRDTWGPFHRAAKQIKLLTRKICLADLFAYQPNIHTNVCILAGSLFYIAQQKYLLSKIFWLKGQRRQLPYITHKHRFLLKTECQCQNEEDFSNIQISNL